MKLDSLDHLIKLIGKLPGLGPKSARRIALFMMQNTDDFTNPLSLLMQDIASKVVECHYCKNIDVINPCNICTNSKRDNHILCVVENISDLWALERTDFFKGKYHVLGGNIAIINGKTPDKLNIDSLIERIKKEDIQEIILATSATLEGQTTAHYIVDILDGLDVKITKPAHGIPIGAELDYMDEGTLALAVKMRSSF